MLPLKMIRPGLIIGVKEGDTLAGDGIDSGDMDMFEAIAVPAGET
jgi:hypothetical protein